MGKRGPKPWKPTPEDLAKIRLYAGLGATHDNIGALMGRSADTLNKHPEVREALAAGKAEVIAKIAGQLVKKALDGNLTAQIFYLKTQAGWKETNVQEHVGRDGDAIRIGAGMTAKEAAELYRAELG